jgi:dolichol-phosphate mannosyltransferase
MKNLVIIPTYNEIENINKIIRTTFSLNKDVDILIVDDSSPDGTASQVTELIDEFKNRLFLINRKQKEGLGKAYITGFKWAISNNYNTIIEMDADFSHDPSEIKNFIYKLENGYDFVIGSRYVKFGKVINWPFMRRFYSKSASVLTRFFTGMPIKDPTSGYVAYNTYALNAIDLEKIRFVGYAFQIEIKYKLWVLEKKYFELPIIFQDRENGLSKMNKKIIKEAIVALFTLPTMNKEILNIKNKF